MKRITKPRRLLPYRASLAGTLLAAREAVMMPLRPILREAGLTDPQWRVLRVLQDGVDMDPSSIARAALLHAPSVTRILKELVDRGLVGRKIDSADGRRSNLILRPAGRKLVEQTAARSWVVVDQMSATFGERRLARLRAELAAFVITMAEPGTTPAPVPHKTRAAPSSTEGSYGPWSSE